ncbi:MAG: cytochrome c oxidase assembly protein [Leifsonia sp.]|uniref:cytochrome c oxidase assembly protein n=1 Tax=Leifsonia sp. TaxID=1870902 RepID=UPI003F7F8989
MSARTGGTRVDPNDAGAPGEAAFREQELRLPPVSVPALLVLLCVPLAVAAALLAMVFSGAFLTGTALLDPGDLVTYGLPVARTLHDIAATATVGFLAVAAFLAPGQTKRPGMLGWAQSRATRWAGWAGAAWFACALAVLLLTGVSVSGVQPADALFWPTLGTFLFGVELGQSLVVSAVAVLVAAVVAALAHRITTAGVAFGFAVFALLPLALSGHAAGSSEHANAVNSLAVHLVGVTLWAGGLLALLLLRTTMKRGFPAAVARYSTLAGWAFAAVAFSGVVNASLRLASPSDLLKPYGILILVKAAVLVLLGIAGALQRRRVIPRLRRDPADRRAFAAFATAEIVFMALAVGVSVGLSRSAPPVSQQPLTGDEAREGLLGFPYPPPVTVERILTVSHIDWVWLALAAVLAGLYVWAFVRLRRRGDPWPVHRLIAWLAGCVALVWLTSGGAAVYGLVHFSTHMVQHMGLMMLAPPLFVLGGPVLLALRVLPARHDGSMGVREWLLLLTHSGYLRFLSRPVVAGVIFAGSLVVFYFTPAFQSAMFSHQWHVLMCVHFLLSGYLFFWVFIGIDPGPPRPAYPILFIVMLATLAFHAFFGVALMESGCVLAADWYHALGQTDDAALLADQHVGGGVAWGASELPMVLVALLVVARWVSSDERAARRLDRQAERDGDAELRAYNERLARLSRRE